MRINITNGSLEEYKRLIESLKLYGFTEGKWCYDKWCNYSETLKILTKTHPLYLNINSKKTLNLLIIDPSIVDYSYHILTTTLLEKILYHYDIHSKEKEQQMKIEIYRTFDFKDRKVTLCVTGNPIKVGYSVKVKEDEENPELGRKIALGRALNDKTNIMNEFGSLFVDCIDNKKAKSILHTIALGFQKRIETGGYEIKGIKE